MTAAAALLAAEDAASEAGRVLRICRQRYDRSRTKANLSDVLAANEVLETELAAVEIARAAFEAAQDAEAIAATRAAEGAEPAQLSLF